MQNFWNRSLVWLSSIVLIACNAPQEPQQTAENSAVKGEVNVYSHRYYDTDKELFRQFEEETGIKVNVKEGEDDHQIELLQSEGENTEADLLLTVDAGRLFFAKKLGLLQPLESSVLEQNIPEYLRDPEKYWYGLTRRARIIVYNKETVDPTQLTSYDDLTNPKWKGQVFVRSSHSIYNQSLMASIIAHQGAERAEAWAKGVVANMVREPKGNDRDQIKEVAAGHGKLALVNSYYLGKLAHSDNELEREAANNVGVFFPNQQTTGTHVNVSGAGLLKNAKNIDNARLLLEFLSSKAAQEKFGQANFEFPVHPEVTASEYLKSWGEFKSDTLNLSYLGLNNAQAVEIFEKAGWK